jgi:3-methyladenine DNA glycosylase AlkD
MVSTRGTAGSRSSPTRGTRSSPSSSRRRSELAERIDRELKAKGTPKRAEGSKAYLKSELPFYGVTSAQMRETVTAVVRETKRDLTRDELTAIARTLWTERVFDTQWAAAELLVQRVDLLGPDDVPLIEQWLREAKTWALVDMLAPAVMGPLVVEHAALGKTLDRWAKDDDFWVRRAAMLSLLVPLRKGGGDFARFTRYADAMLDEKEFFIRKAIGWILRETGRKTPDRVYAWLLPRAKRAAGLTVREATKYLSPKQKAEIARARD